jgi:hypothetical protein
MNEHEPLEIPPWSKRRRIATTATLTVFIIFAAAWIGVGIYQIGVQRGWVRKPLTKQTILDSLAHDTSFIKAVKHIGSSRTCENIQRGFSLSYWQPIHPLTTSPAKETCQHFVAMHPTGADIFIDIASIRIGREAAMTEKASEYDYVQSELMTGTRYQIGRLSGMKQGVETITYVIGTSISSSWIVTYKLVSPTITPIVESMVLSFRLY